MKNVDDALFLLVRHGQSFMNSEDKFRGWADNDDAKLDTIGIKQAKIAGRFLHRLPVKFGIIFSSDLDRSIHTAAIIARILGIDDIYLDKRLRPLNVGEFTGEDKATSNIDFYLENPDESFPGGESVVEFRDRWKDFTVGFQQWVDEHPNEKAIIVDHLSGVVYWQDLSKALKGYLEEYASDKEDLIRPGGIVAVMPDNEVIALLGENKTVKESDKGEE